MSNKRYTVLVRHTEVYEKEFSVTAFDKAGAEELACDAAARYSWARREFPADDKDEAVEVSEGSE